MSAPARIQAALDRVRATEPTVPKIRHAVSDLPRAVAVMPEHRPERSVSAAADYCAARGYRLAAVANLRVALSMVLDQVADVVVCANDADLLPFIELTDALKRRPATVRRDASRRPPTQRRPAPRSESASDPDAVSPLLRRPQPRLRGPFGD